jgi:hypothetical protein
MKTRERIAAECVCREVYGPYMATVNEEHRELAIAGIEQIIREAGSGPGPKCPECGSTELTVLLRDTDDDGWCAFIHCSDNQTHPMWKIEDGSDMTKFFPPYPPRTVNGRRGQ